MSEGSHAEFGNQHMLRFIRPRHKGPACHFKGSGSVVSFGMDETYKVEIQFL